MLIEVESLFSHFHIEPKSLEFWKKIFSGRGKVKIKKLKFFSIEAD